MAKCDYCKAEGTELGHVFGCDFCTDSEACMRRHAALHKDNAIAVAENMAAIKRIKQNESKDD